MTSSNRGDRIQLLHKVVKKYYKPVVPPDGRTLLEQLVYACCLEDARYESADEAFHRLQESYFDWNEIRVTTVTELAEVLHNLPEPVAAGARVKRNLQSIFESRYSFDIEDMGKMNQGKAIQELEKFGGMSKFVLGYLVQNAFGGHTIPVSNSIMQILVATGILSQQEADKNNTPGLDRAIAKSKGIEFASCVHQLAADIRAQPSNKNLKLILKEAGAVEQPKRPVAPPPPEKKPEPKKAVSTKEKENVKEPESKPAAGKAPAKPIAAKATPEVKAAAEAKPTPKKSAEPKAPPAKAVTHKQPPQRKPPEKKPSPPATTKKDSAKKNPTAKKPPPQKMSKRKPK